MGCNCKPLQKTDQSTNQMKNTMRKALLLCLVSILATCGALTSYARERVKVGSPSTPFKMTQVESDEEVAFRKQHDIPPSNFPTGEILYIESTAYQFEKGSPYYFILSARTGKSPARYFVSLLRKGKPFGNDVIISDATGTTLLAESVEQSKERAGLVTAKLLTAVLTRDWLNSARHNGGQLKVTFGSTSLVVSVASAVAADFLNFVDDHNYYQMQEDKKDELARINAAQEKRLREARHKREVYVAENPQIPEKLKAYIIERVFVVGLTQEDVTAAWGVPQKKNYSDGVQGRSEQWVYIDAYTSARTYLYFVHGKLTNWSGEN